MNKVHSYQEIEEALETLQLPLFITREDIKQQYRFLAKKNHPDRGGNTQKMEALNEAYQILTHYIDHFRFSFTKEEILKQIAGESYGEQFNP